MPKPLVVFVFSFEGSATSTRYGGFSKRLQKAGGLKDCEVLTVALENLLFIIKENGEADIIDAVSSRSLGDASLVYMKSWVGLVEEANTLANFLLYRGVPFMDTSVLGPAISKVSSAYKLWGSGIVMPMTLYTRRHDRLLELIKTFKDELGEKFILKDANGAKGKINYLVSIDEVSGTLEKHPDIQFIAQRFIPNDGDYRIGVYANKSRFVIERIGSGETHLNNISAGGKATYVEIKDMSSRILKLAEKASRAVDLQISGVDIILDKITKKPYVLEVNQGSQIVTGAFVDENVRALNAALEDLVHNRYSRTRKQPNRTIGRRASVMFKTLGIEKVTAKVDTGAYSSTLHADNIHISHNDKGVRELVFDISPSERLVTIDGKVQTIKTTDFFDQKVRSSNGQVQYRYSIRTRISVEGRIFPVVLTLSNRSEMGYPLLIGRRVLRSRFLVNVELNEYNQADLLDVDKPIK